MSAYIHRGHVYFVACGQYVKIGYTSAGVEKRIYALGNAVAKDYGIVCPPDLDRTKPLTLVHLIPGCVMRDERRLHGLFAAHRVEGEWFTLDDGFLEKLEALEYVTYSESLSRFRRARADLKRRPSLAVAA